MITCTLHQLEQRARQRGYTLADVRGCVVSEDAGMVVVDESHVQYPREARHGPQRPDAGDGPGDQLKRLLSSFGISGDAGCGCSDRAALMNFWGAEGCAARVNTIVGWLREEAEKRGLPFFAPVARLLVKRAIAKARKTTLE